MMTSSLSPTSATSVVMSSRPHGESRLLTRVHSWVSPMSTERATLTRPARAASLSAIGIASSRLPSRMSTVGTTSGNLATTLSICGGKKWMTRLGRNGISRNGAGRADSEGFEEVSGATHERKGMCRWGRARNGHDGRVTHDSRRSCSMPAECWCFPTRRCSVRCSRTTAATRRWKRTVERTTPAWRRSPPPAAARCSGTSTTTRTCAASVCADRDADAAADTAAPHPQRVSCGDGRFPESVERVGEPWQRPGCRWAWCRTPAARSPRCCRGAACARRATGRHVAVRVVVDSHLVGVAKPDPRIFDHALPYFDGIEREQIAYVGDSVTMDIGARARGRSAPDPARPVRRPSRRRLRTNSQPDRPDVERSRRSKLDEFERRRHGERPLVAVAGGDRSRGVLHAGGRRLEASGQPAHGEADFIESLHPPSVLDAGCGMGRVAIELARRGIDVVGVDLDDELLEFARRSRAIACAGCTPTWRRMRLDRTFDVVAMPGNVMMFCRPSDRRRSSATALPTSSPSGSLVAGFQLESADDALTLADYDEMCADSGLELVERWSTWQRDPYRGDNYAVSVHRRV